MSHTNQCGFFYSLPFEEYQTLPGLNQSKLKQLLSSPSKQKQGYQIQQAMNFGNAGHCLLLEPHKFEELYVCAPKTLRRRGKNGKKSGKNFVSLTQEKMCSPQLNGNNYKKSARFSISILKSRSFGSMARQKFQCSGRM